MPRPYCQTHDADYLCSECSGHGCEFCKNTGIAMDKDPVDYDRIRDERRDRMMDDEIERRGK
jgi:hypothetical protein